MPGSTTERMPGTVSEVSATLVAITTRRLGWARRPGAVRRRTAGRTAAAPRCAAGPGPRAASAVSRISRSPDWNTSTSPGPSRISSGDRIADRAWTVVVARVVDGSVADLHRIGAAGHFDDRRRTRVAAKCGGEALGVDGGGGDDDLEVGPTGEELAEVAEDEVDVEAALVGLVDDDRVVGRAGRGRAGARPAGSRRSSP